MQSVMVYCDIRNIKTLQSHTVNLITHMQSFKQQDTIIRMFVYGQFKSKVAPSYSDFIAYFGIQPMPFKFGNKY